MSSSIPSSSTAVLNDVEGVDLDRRFGGLARLYGAAGASQIRAAHVVVVGLGGVGSWAAEALARSGVAKLTLVDLDHVAESNVNRQIHAIESTFGQAKVLAMQGRIGQINPTCQVVCVEEFVDEMNWPGVAGLDHLDTQRAFAVIDACDQVKAKVAMSVWAMQQKVDFISVGAAGGKRHAHQVEISDLALVTHDPLLAQLRYRLRKMGAAKREGKNIGLPCVFSKEAVLQPDTCDAMLPSSAAADAVGNDGSLNCHGYGSVVSVTSTFGMCAAGWVLDRIARSRKPTEN